MDFGILLCEGIISENARVYPEKDGTAKTVISVRFEVTGEG